MKAAFVAIAAVITLVGSLAQPATARERTYYVAADDVIWNYAPSGRNLEDGSALPPLIPGQLGWSYHKLLYREYTDATFRTLAPVAPDRRYLGFLGPLMRAEVGDTIVVVLRNHTHQQLDIAPHGLHVVSAPPKALAPGKTGTYRWAATDDAGPGPSDGSSFLWTYTPSDRTSGIMASGLIGPIIVTRRGMARADGSPTDVDRELVIGFREEDESESVMLPENVADGATNPRHVPTKVAAIPFGRNVFVSLNGFGYGNMPMLTMHRGERVRWYLFSSESTFDFHAPTWTGNTVVWNGQRADTIALGVSDRAIADMVPDDLGVWKIYCTLNIHLGAGMEARYTVVP